METEISIGLAGLLSATVGQRYVPFKLFLSTICHPLIPEASSQARGCDEGIDLNQVTYSNTPVPMQICGRCAYWSNS